MTRLRDMLAEERAPWPAWADAEHHATRRLGGDVTSLIDWDHRYAGDGRIYGTVICIEGRLRVRFEQQEPGAERLEIRVACPHDPACTHAWDVLEHRRQLLGVLDGGTAVGDPQCDVHDCD